LRSIISALAAASSRSAVEFRAAGIPFVARVVTPAVILVCMSSANGRQLPASFFAHAKLID
jgi:hypothetical protein